MSLQLILLCMVIHVARNVKLLTTLFQEASGFIKVAEIISVELCVKETFICRPCLPCIFNH
jgi:hypothetical protein